MAVRRRLRKCILVPHGMHLRGYNFFIIERTLRGYNVCLVFITFFRNQQVAVPLPGLLSCRYRKLYHSAYLRLDGWKLYIRLLSTVSTYHNTFSPFFCVCQRKLAVLRVEATDGYLKRQWKLNGFGKRYSPPDG